MRGIGRRQLWLAVAVSVVVALSVAAYKTLGRPPASGHAQRIGVEGGTAWNPDRSVGVRIAPHGVVQPTAVEFRQPDRTPPESPLSDLFDVVAPAVDVVADGAITDAQVVFVLDPRVVPAAPSPGTTTDRRTIANAGIEVFNDTVGAWIPIPTTVENGNQLVAHAPHFSLFRAVWNKLGEVAVKAGHAVKVVLTAAMQPLDLLWRTGLALAKTTFDSLLGRFDDTKYDCGKRNRSYTVTVTDSTGQGKLDACVVQPNPGHERLLMKNGLAVPFKFAGGTGLAPDLLTGELDTLSLARGLVGTLTGDVYASGLDVAAFDLRADTPKHFTVNGELNWASMAVDYTIGLLTALLPESKVIVAEYRTAVLKIQEKFTAEVTRTTFRLSYERITQLTEIVLREQRTTPTVAARITGLMEATNCALEIGQKIVVNDWHDLPGNLADIARTCLLETLKTPAGETKDAVDLLKKVASDAKALPALGQLAAIDILMFFTGKVIAQVAFQVTWVDPALAPLLGAWHAHGANLTLNPDGTGTLWSNYGPCLPFDTVHTDMCAENWAFTFTAANGGAEGKVTRVWITTWDGKPPPSGVDTQYLSGKVSDSLRFSIPDRPDIIRMNAAGFNAGSNAEFCRTNTNAYDTGRCGG